MRSFLQLLTLTYLLGTCTPLSAQFDQSIGELATVRGVVEVSFKEGPWQITESGIELKSGDRVRTLESSSALVKMYDETFHQLQELTTIRVGTNNSDSSYSLIDGIIYFFSRRNGGTKKYSTDIVTAAIKGTEFVVEATPEGEITFHMIEGEVELTTDSSLATLTSGESATTSSGKINTQGQAVFGTAIQWFAYFPAILVIEDLNFKANLSPALESSLTAFGNGNYQKAALYLQTSSSGQTNEMLYRANLLLLVGQFEKALEIARSVKGDYESVAQSIENLVQVILPDQPIFYSGSLDSSSEWLSASYQYQAQGDLKMALMCSDTALITNKSSGLIHARRAELLFSLGNYNEAMNAAERALKFSPHMVSATSTLAFLNAVSGNTEAALELFNTAIIEDPSFPDAWLGHGLLNFQNGQSELATRDIETAISLSPLRSTFRTYLARIFMEEGNNLKAKTELHLALDLDENDPNTNLIYSLLKASEYNFRDSIKSLRKSLNNNNLRSMHRSATLLSEDTALRKTNLAQVYSDAGLELFGFREASIAISKDPGSFTSHQFLARAFQTLEDPSATSLRYQSPTQAEQLSFDVFSPAQYGLLPFSPSPNDYNNLLSSPSSQLNGQFRGIAEHGFSADLYWSQSHDRYSFTLNGSWDYIDNFGSDWNFDRKTLEAGFKIDLSQQDTLTTIVRSNKNKTADSTPFNQGLAGHQLFDEDYPSALLAWRHSWSPESETVAYLQYISHDQFINTSGSAFVTNHTGTTIQGLLSGDIVSASSSNALQLEIQHRQSWNSNHIITGIRTQSGNWSTHFELTNSPVSDLSLTNKDNFDRIEAYVYSYFALSDTFTLISGLNATRFTYPINSFTLPPSAGTETIKTLLPKLGFNWEATPDITIRGAFSQTLGGLALDDGYRLEPTQVAGFLQGYRSLMSESIDGTHPAVEFETFGLGLTWSSPSSYFLDLELNSRESNSDRGLGRFISTSPLTPSAWNTFTNYSENIAQVTFARILAEATTLSLNYGYTQSEISSTIPAIAAVVKRKGNLSNISFKANHRTRNGFFGSAAFTYFDQSTDEFTWSNNTLIASQTNIGRDAFHIDLEFGWTVKSGKPQFSFGVKNLLNEEIRIDPINWTPSRFPGRTVYFDIAW